jgi:hypothetical protein
MNGQLGQQCGRCHGVLIAADPDGYTRLRARLILTHGYCRCADAPATGQAAALLEERAEAGTQRPVLLITP